MFGGGPEWNHSLGTGIIMAQSQVIYMVTTDKFMGSVWNATAQPLQIEVKPGEWYHSAHTYDSEDLEMRGYVDGEKDHSFAMMGVVSATQVSSLAIGAGFWDNREFWIGTLDEVRLYNRALTQDEVKQNYAVKSNSLAVSSKGKLCETWAKIKTSR